MDKLIINDKLSIIGVIIYAEDEKHIPYTCGALISIHGIHYIVDSFGLERIIKNFDIKAVNNFSTVTLSKNGHTLASKCTVGNKLIKSINKNCKTNEEVMEQYAISNGFAFIKRRDINSIIESIKD